MTRKGQQIKYKKAPGAPKRFKSAYMFFSEQMHKQIRQTLVNKKMRAAEVAKLVSKAWKELPDEGRYKWIELGRRDRERYEREKAVYKGPWKIPDIKHPNAPKRPCSAFLAFSNERRKIIVAENPHLDGTQISSALSKIWKQCPESVKQMYREKEARGRELYKQQRAAWDRQRDMALSQTVAVVENVSSSGSEMNSVETNSQADTSQPSSSNDDDTLVQDEDFGMMAFNDVVFGKEELWNSYELGQIDTAGSFVSFASTKPNMSNLELMPNHSWSAVNVPQKINLPSKTSSIDSDFYRNDALTVFGSSLQSVPTEALSTSVDCKGFQPPAKEESRFESLSMDQILEDDELFEDFSPFHVTDIGSTSAMRPVIIESLSSLPSL